MPTGDRFGPEDARHALGAIRMLRAATWETAKAGHLAAGAAQAEGEQLALLQHKLERAAKESPGGLRCISLTQPWATLIAIGAKHWETRSRSTPHRGPLAIAASASFPRDARAVCGMPEARQVLATAGYDRAHEGQLPLGVILCVVDVVDCVETEVCFNVGRALDDVHDDGFDRGALIAESIRSHSPLLKRVNGVRRAEHEQLFGDYSAGRFAYLTRNTRRLREPVPVEHFEKGRAVAGGALGIFALPSHVEAAVRAQLGGAHA